MRCETAGYPAPRTEGEDNGEWIIVDCGAAVVHVMQPAIREYYHLEEIWGDKPVRMKIGAAPPTRLVKAARSRRATRRRAMPRQRAPRGAKRAAPAERAAEQRAAPPAQAAERREAGAAETARSAGKRVVRTVGVKTRGEARHGRAADEGAPRKPAAKKTSAKR